MNEDSFGPSEVGEKDLSFIIMTDKLYKNLPDTPGVYLMKGEKGKLLYVGKAANLKRRVSSYFLRPHDIRIEKMVSEIKKIDHEKTDSALEALILEAELIKRHEPPYNIREKDNKSFLYVQITKDKWPQVLLVRGRGRGEKIRAEYGPFVSGSSIREALKIVRHIFPFSIHPNEKVGTFKRPCFDYQIHLCPGTCVGAITREDYLKDIRRIKLIFEGKKKKILRDLEREMKVASRATEFEQANKLKRQIFALRHIQDTALIGESDPVLQATSSELKAIRIEGYDISNISGTSAVGSMVVFVNGNPDKNEYRKFKIKTISGANDVGMMEEVLTRRFHNKWQLPNLILVDGGEAQVNVAEDVIKEFRLNIPVVGIVKGPDRKRNDFIGVAPKGIDEKTLIRVRDEAHRFAISYHKNLRGREFMK